MTRNSLADVDSYDKVNHKVAQPHVTHYVKLFGKDINHRLPLGKRSVIKSSSNDESTSNYERNRKLLARVFIIWSIILIVLLFNVLDIL